MLKTLGIPVSSEQLTAVQQIKFFTMKCLVYCW